MPLFGFQKRNKNAVTLPLVIGSSTWTTKRLYTGKDSTAFAAIDKIANSFASLNFGVYSYSNREKQREHYLYKLMKEPNAEETHSIFFSSMIQDYYNSGNVYLYVVRNSDKEVISLFRLNPLEVKVSRNADNEKIFTYNGTEYKSDTILHIPSRFDYNGLIGKSIFDACKSVFDTSTNLSNYTENSFDNSIGKRPVAEFDSKLTEEQVTRFREQFDSSYTGVENAGKVLITYPGLKYNVLDSGNSDNRSQQLQELRAYQAEIISTLFQIPVDYLNGRGSDIEALTTMYAMNAIQPLCQIFEESFTKLMNVLDREDFYVEFDYGSLVKASLSQRTDILVKQLTNGLISVNEARAKENMSELPEAGDNWFIGSNLVPLNDETINAFMAKQKQVVSEIGSDKKDYENHSAAGDDKSIN